MTSARFLLRSALLAMAFPSIMDAPAEDVSEPQVLQEATPLLIPAEPFLISITWQPDGTLAISPEWADLGSSLDSTQIQQPPTLRTSSDRGWLVGELALQDGTWSPFFTIPLGETKTKLDGASTTEEALWSSTAFHPVSETTAVSIRAENFATVIDPLAVGVADPLFPKNVSLESLLALVNRPLTPGNRRFFVNNASGDDAAGGEMVHPQKDNRLGPLASVAAALRKLRSGDEIVVVGTGLPYKFTPPETAEIEITMTPIGEVFYTP